MIKSKYIASVGLLDSFYDTRITSEGKQEGLLKDKQEDARYY